MLDLVLLVVSMGPTKEEWTITETPHFRIFHKQEKDFIEKVALVAETTRKKVNRKWFNNDGEAWAQKCELFLYATGSDYERATGVSMVSLGHTAVESDESGRVVSRSMHLRCDIAGLLDGLLPHETTHAVLAGQFGRHLVPRWADEGIAVLSETKEVVDRHRHSLAEYAKERRLFGLKELMEMKDYPKPARVKAFHVQSICVTDFLSRGERGPITFTKFVRDGLDRGYEVSLQNHYGCNFAVLEERWQKFLVAEKLLGK